MSKKTNIFGEKAQAIAEFALILPVLMFIIMATIQLGIILNAYMSVTNMTRDAVRFASLNPDTDQGIIDHVNTYRAVGIALNDYSVSITPAESSATRSYSNLIQIKITYDLRSKMFLPTSFGIGSLRINFPTVFTTQATMRIE